MMRKTTITAMALGVTGLGALALWTMRPAAEKPHPKTDRQAPSVALKSASCQFKADDTLAFAVTDRTTSRIDPGALLAQLKKTQRGGLTFNAQVQDVKKVITYRLDLTVLGHDKQDAILGGRLSDLTQSGDNTNDISDHKALAQTPLWLRVSPDCAITAFGWVDKHEKLAREQQTLLGELNWRLPANRARLSATERNILGQYEAAYVRQQSAKGAVIHKRLMHFERAYGVSQQKMQLRAQVSKGQVLKADAPWFDALEWQWQVRLLPGGIDMGVVQRHVTAKATEAQPRAIDQNDKNWRAPDMRWGWLVEKPNRDLQLKAQTKPTLFKNLKGLPLNLALSNFLDKVRDPKVGFQVYTAYLRDWIRQNPEQLPALLAAIQAGKFDERFAKSAVFYALGEAHTPQARQAILGIFQDPEWKANHRLQAGWGMSRDLAFAPQATEAVLLAMDNPKDALIHDQVSLLAGAMANQQQRTHPKQAEALQARLKKTLNTKGATNEALSNALLGLGNAQDVKHLPKIAEFMSHASPGVQRAAINAIKNLPIEHIEPVIQNNFKQNKHSDQRAEMLDALFIGYAGEKRAPSAEALELAETSLSSTTLSKEERDRALALLALAARLGNESARAVLEHELQQSLAQKPRDYDLINALGKYLGGNKRK